MKALLWKESHPVNYNLCFIRCGDFPENWVGRAIFFFYERQKFAERKFFKLYLENLVRVESGDLCFLTLKMLERKW